jgi:hypothetical protein
VQIGTVLTQKPGEGSMGVAWNVAASGPRSHQRFGARAYRCRPYCGRQDHAGLVHQECALVHIRKARSRRASACYCVLAILPMTALVAKSGPNASALSTPRSWASLERARLTRLFTVPTAHLVISAVSS